MKIESKQLKNYLEKARTGDQKAFNYLLDSFWNEVFNFQLRRTQNENDAEDITIQTFSKAFDKIESYDSRYDFKTWLFTISKNIHLDLLRKQKSSIITNTTDQSEKLTSLADNTPTAEDKIIRQQNLDKLLRDIKKLKPAYRQVINLRYFQEMSYIEIAKKLNEPLSNIKVKLLRAKKLLASIIKNTHALFF